MSVSNKHPNYELYKPSWTKTRDAVRGSVAVKDKRHTYLPVPDAESTPWSALHSVKSPRSKYLRAWNTSSMMRVVTAWD
jgi:hypothetical protein